MKGFYEYTSRNHLLETLIEKSYEIYIKEKDGYKTIDDKVNELYERIEYLEKQVSKKDTSNKIPSKHKQETSPSTKPTQTNFQPDEIQQIIINMKSNKTPSLEISEKLNTRGYTTLKGREITRNWVDKQIFKLRKEGLISWFDVFWIIFISKG